MDNYQKGWNEALLILRTDTSDTICPSLAYWEGKMDAFNRIKKRIWIKNPEVKGGGFFQEREVSPVERKSNQRLKQALASLEEGRDLLSSIPSAPRDRVRPLHNAESLRAKLNAIDDESEIRDKAGNIKDKNKQESAETFGQIKSKYVDAPELSPISEYRPHHNPEVEKSLQTFSQKNRFNDFESLNFIDENTGEILLDKKGEESSVSITDQEIKQVAWNVSVHNHPSNGRDQKIKLTEEQIDNGDYPIFLLGQSFSDSDLKSALKSKENEMRVTSLGYDYVMRFPEPISNSYNPNTKERTIKITNEEYGDENEYELNSDRFRIFELESLMDNIDTEIRIDLIPQLIKQYGEDAVFSDTQGDGGIYTFDYAHEKMSRIAQKLGFEYKKMRNNTPDSKIKEELLRRYGDKQNG
jgi:hypothetical protein